MISSRHNTALRFIAAFMLAAVCSFNASASKPRIHVIATGGTIAGRLSSSERSYDAGQVGIATILEAVPQLSGLAELDYEQFCNIGSQDMNEAIWLGLSRRVQEVLDNDAYDAVVITHGTDTMEETAFFLSLTTRTAKPVVLVGSMRASDDPQADGPANLLTAVKVAASPWAVGKDVMCCLGGEIFEAGGVFKNDTHSIYAFAEGRSAGSSMENVRGMFDISSVKSLPQVGIIYGYAGCSTIPLEAFVKAGFKGVVLAGVGMGNFYSDVMDAALEAASKGVVIVRASRVPHGGVYTELGEVDDTECGFVAARSLNPQKARIMLMLALTRTSDISQIRQYFDSDRRTVHPAR